METINQNVTVTTIKAADGKALKNNEKYAISVTGVGLSGWEEVSMAEYEAWKEAEKAKAEEERLKQ